jgi:hypothetical protein
VNVGSPCRDALQCVRRLATTPCLPNPQVASHGNATSSLDEPRIAPWTYPNQSTISIRSVLGDPHPDPLPPRKEGGRGRIGSRMLRYPPRLFGAKVMACGHRGAHLLSDALPQERAQLPRHVRSSVITQLASELRRLSLSASGSTWGGVSSEALVALLCDACMFRRSAAGVRCDAGSHATVRVVWSRQHPSGASSPALERLRGPGLPLRPD